MRHRTRKRRRRPPTQASNRRRVLWLSKRHRPRLILYEERPKTKAHRWFLGLALCICLAAVDAAMLKFLYSQNSELTMLLSPCLLLLPLVALPLFAALASMRTKKESDYKPPDPNGVQYWE